MCTKYILYLIVRFTHTTLSFDAYRDDCEIIMDAKE